MYNSCENLPTAVSKTNKINNSAKKKKNINV